MHRLLAALTLAFMGLGSVAAQSTPTPAAGTLVVTVPGEAGVVGFHLDRPAVLANPAYTSIDGHPTFTSTAPLGAHVSFLVSSGDPEYPDLLFGGRSWDGTLFATSHDYQADDPEQPESPEEEQEDPENVESDPEPEGPDTAQWILPAGDYTLSLVSEAGPFEATLRLLEEDGRAMPGTATLQATPSAGFIMESTDVENTVATGEYTRWAAGQAVEVPAMTYLASFVEAPVNDTWTISFCDSEDATTTIPVGPLCPRFGDLVVSAGGGFTTACCEERVYSKGYVRTEPITMGFGIDFEVLGHAPEFRHAVVAHSQVTR